jgi:hypothetical protein
MLHNPSPPEKVDFLAFKTLLSPFGTREKNFFVNLNDMILQTIRNECAKFGGHVGIEVSYKILCLKILNGALIFLNSPCFQ